MSNASIDRKKFSSAFVYSIPAVIWSSDRPADRYSNTPFTWTSFSNTSNMHFCDHFSRMPLEILGEILIHCTASDPDAPAQLGAISRQFHSAVNSTPSVWQRLNLSVSAHSQEACIRKANLWFSRAAACNISLHVELKQQAVVNSWARGNLAIYLQDPSQLGFTLRQFSSRIESLEVEATSARDFHVFISLIYNSEEVDEESNMELRNLSIKINSEGSLAVTPSSISSTLRLPTRIHLSMLHLVNHMLPRPSSINCETLRFLTITRPLRSSPLHLRTILEVLRATKVLVSLEVSGRIVDGPLPQAEDKDETSDAEENDHIVPLTLSSLTHLSLRSNLIPPVISSLILPELHTLRLDDLDGRRLNASVETGTMLRRLLVRMELPRETRKGTGLKALELTSVAIQPPATKEDNIWDWCFKRMRSLEHLCVKNTNVDGLMDILVSPSKALVGAHGRNGFRGDPVCPRLQSLSIVSSRTSQYIAMFERTRRSVDLKFVLIDDPLNSFYPDFSDTILPDTPSSTFSNNGNHEMKGLEAKIE